MGTVSTVVTKGESDASRKERATRREAAERDREIRAAHSRRSKHLDWGSALKRRVSNMGFIFFIANSYTFSYITRNLTPWTVVSRRNALVAATALPKVIVTLCLFSAR